MAVHVLQHMWLWS